MGRLVDPSLSYGWRETEREGEKRERNRESVRARETEREGERERNRESVRARETARESVCRKCRERWEYTEQRESNQHLG